MIVFWDETVRFRSAVDLAGYLRDRIRDGTLGPGSRMPSERDMMQATGFGRETVRRAVSILRHEGIIRVRRGEGMMVPEFSEPEMVRLQRGSRLVMRMPTPEERDDFDLDDGIPVVVVSYGGRVRVYPADRYEFTTS